MAMRSRVEICMCSSSAVEKIAEMEHIHISTLELMAITRSLEQFQHRCAHAPLSISTDSAVVVAVLQRSTTSRQTPFVVFMSRTQCSMKCVNFASSTTPALDQSLVDLLRNELGGAGVIECVRAK